MSVIDLNSLKENIQTFLEDQNTSTGATIRDLSSDMDNRVTKVFKKHPRHLINQASLMPCVTVFIDGKTIDNTTISPNQRTQAKRKASISIQIAGMIWDNNFASNDDDEAEDDLESLMENIEEIIRNDPTVDGAVDWLVCEGVDYFTLYKTDAHMLTGVMTCRATKFY
jgi:hypothetical protein